MRFTVLAASLFVTACAVNHPAATPPAQIKPAPNEADVEFMTGMIHHHSQAVEMANWAPTHDAGPELQRLAARIKVAQTDEIALMTNWLRDRGLEPHQHKMMMPGMLTDEQMAQLDAAKGKEFDKLFLRFMIQHHQGAVTMVEKLQGSYGAAQDEIVFRFSQDVVADQTTEIERMGKMLAALERQ